ncbi:hypothetical protein ACQ4PT_043324 [Festuca glaucescens]
MSEIAPSPAPSPGPATRQKLSVFEPLEERIKELTSSQAELLGRIQNLKQEVQKWRSNVEAQSKTLKTELLDTKEALGSEVQNLKSDIKEISSAVQEEKASSNASFRNLEESNDETEQARQTQD